MIKIKWMQSAMVFLVVCLSSACLGDPKSWPPPEKEVFEKVFSSLDPSKYHEIGLGTQERTGDFIYFNEKDDWIQLSSMDPKSFECVGDSSCRGEKNFIRDRLIEIQKADVILVDGRYDCVHTHTRITKRGLRYILMYNPDYSKEDVKNHFTYQGGQIGDYGNGWFSFLSSSYQGSY